MFSFFNKTMSDNSKTFFDFKINSIMVRIRSFDLKQNNIIGKCC